MGSRAYRQRMLDAIKENRKEDLEIRRRVAGIYEKAAEDMTRRASLSKSGGLTEAFSYALSRELKERSTALWQEVGDVTRTAMQGRAERMVGVQTAFLLDAAQRAEVDLKPTMARVFATVNDDAVRHVLEGGLYGGNAPTLSKRIWNNAALQSGQIEEIIAGGIAKKQSAIQLAKHLEAYLRPDIMQPDTWNEVYPDMPFIYKVDYNAKRLAVTSINHAGWAATLMAARNNPFADFLHWELTPAHVINDVCDGYAEHDEGLGEGNWNLDAAPLPHPFCTCLWYVDTNKTLDEIGRELRAWEEGGSNERLDQAFGKWEQNVISFKEKFAESKIRNAVFDEGVEVDEEVISAVMNTVDRIQADFPTLNRVTQVIFSPKENGFAAASNDGTAIRLEYGLFKNMQSLREAFWETVKSGHTVNAEDPMFVIAHEMGHLIHTHLALRKMGLNNIPRDYPYTELYVQSRREILINLFQNSIFTTESVNEIYEMVEKELGSRAMDSNDEMLAQAFGMYYYGKGEHPIADSYVKYLMSQFKEGL